MNRQSIIASIIPFLFYGAVNAAASAGSIPSSSIKNTASPSAATPSSSSSSSIPSSSPSPSPSSSTDSSSSIYSYLSSIPYLTLPSGLDSLNWSTNDLLSLPSLWWHHYIRLWEREPLHVGLELFFLLLIIYLLLRKPYDPNKKQYNKLSKQEEEELIKSWEPIGLHEQGQGGKKSNEIIPKYKDRGLIVESMSGSTVTVNGTSCLNFGSYNFLGLIGHPDIESICRSTIDRYGVGSCGPRGFYGTFDVHLEIEKKLAEYMEQEEAILYSDGIACLSSVIPAFSKRGDLIIADERCHYGIQQGILLSRSNVFYYKHNDMDDLLRILQSVKENDIKQGLSSPTNRRFIIIEGIYQNTGSIVPLDKIIQLKNQFKYRIIMDDSIGFGVLGPNGKGTPDYYSIPIKEIDMYCGTMDCSLSTVGGFCIGSHQIIDHQRLSGAGYCFSASSPPYCVIAGIKALELMQNQEKNNHIVCKKNAKLLYDSINKLGLKGALITGDASSPILHIRLSPSKGKEQDQLLFDDIADHLLINDNIVIDIPLYIPAERSPPLPSIRLLIGSHHTEKQIKVLTEAIGKAWKKFIAK